MSFATSNTWQKWLAGALFVFLAWVSLGHHRYLLAGDAALNFRQHVFLEEDYFEDNLEALTGSQEEMARGTVRHVRLLEGGFPFVLYLARQLGLRAPFLVNALLLPFLFLFLALGTEQAEAEPRRRLLAAVLALLWLLSGPGARLIWSLALPFRDTLSHTLGFAALAVLYLAARRPERAAWRVFGAGLLVGLCGWTRLPGFLFAIPAATLVLCFPEFGTWRRRLLLVLFLGAGVSIGLGLVGAQNIFEGRHALMPPQADKLVLQSAFRRGSEGLIRKGWHPLNLPQVLPKVLGHVQAMHPAWLNLLALLGLAGWCAAARRQARQAIPLAVGLAVYLLFYGSYDKVLTRYLAILLLFSSALAGLAGAWLVDALGRVLERGARFRPAAGGIRAAAAVAAALAVAAVAWRSGPDWRRAQGEWRDALRFRDWLAAGVPENAEIWSNDPPLENWIVHFGGFDRLWPMNLLKGRTIDPNHVKLPAGPAYVLAPFKEDPEQYFRGWTHDALLNRFDLEPQGEPVFFGAGNFAGARLVRVAERRLMERDVAVRRRKGFSRTLYLYLRDLPPGVAEMEAALASPLWPREWPVRLRPGVNLLMPPAEFTARPADIRLRGGTPLPSILEAAWLNQGVVGVPAAGYQALVSRLLQVEDATVEWDGYLRWWRDWNDYGEPYVAIPRVIMDPVTRIRLPAVSGAEGLQLVLRLSYSAVFRTRAALAQAHRLRYRLGSEPVVPATLIRHPFYSYKEEATAIDFVQEVRLDADQAAAGWLDLEQPSAGGSALYLHHLEYRLEPPGSAAPSPVTKQVFSTRWMRWGYNPH